MRLPHPASWVRNDCLNIKLLLNIYIHNINKTYIYKITYLNRALILVMDLIIVLKRKERKMWLKSVIEGLKLPPKLLLAISMGTGLLLYLPDNIILKLKFDIITSFEYFQPWCSIFFFTSTILLINHLIFWIKDLIYEKYLLRQEQKNYLNTLKNLSPEEKRVLSIYHVKKTKSLRLSSLDGVANGLEDIKVLYKSDGIIDAGTMKATYNIQPLAREELNKNPLLLEPELSQMVEKIKSKTR